MSWYEALGIDVPPGLKCPAGFSPEEVEFGYSNGGAVEQGLPYRGGRDAQELRRRGCTHLYSAPLLALIAQGRLGGSIYCCPSAPSQQQQQQQQQQQPLVESGGGDQAATGSGVKVIVGVGAAVAAFLLLKLVLGRRGGNAVERNPDLCPACGGVGSIDRPPYEDICEECGGTGFYSGHGLPLLPRRSTRGAPKVKRSRRRQEAKDEEARRAAMQFHLDTDGKLLDRWPGGFFFSSMEP